MERIRDVPSLPHFAEETRLMGVQNGGTGFSVNPIAPEIVACRSGEFRMFMLIV